MVQPIRAGASDVRRRADLRDQPVDRRYQFQIGVLRLQRLAIESNPVQLFARCGQPGIGDPQRFFRTVARAGPGRWQSIRASGYPLALAAWTVVSCPLPEPTAPSRHGLWGRFYLPSRFSIALRASSGSAA